MIRVVELPGLTQISVTTFEPTLAISLDNFSMF